MDKTDEEETETTNNEGDIEAGDGEEVGGDAQNVSRDDGESFGEEDDDDDEEEDEDETDDDETEDEDETEENPVDKVKPPPSPNSVPTCYICLNEFEGQDIGTPENCERIHFFCLECLEEWSKVSI